MTEQASNIPTSALFADLQVTLTEIQLIEMLPEDKREKHESRLNGNYQIRDSILAIMQDRFSPDDIDKFLKDGYEREVSIAETFVSFAHYSMEGPNALGLG